MACCSLQEVFQQGLETFAGGRRLHSRELRAAESIAGCYTQAMGSHTLACLAGDFSKLQFHACRHRSCPRCADSARKAWIDAEMARLLPCPHFHTVFTIAHSLLPLWALNRSWFINALFDASRLSLLQLLANPRHLGAEPGILMSLHTWGRNLSHHPHIHCLVSAGGIDSDGQWRNCRPRWLAPVQALKKLFRGKLLDALWQALPTLLLPPGSDVSTWQRHIKQLYRKPFNVEIQPPYEHGRGVVLYLARYAKGGPIPSERPLRLRDGVVLMPYTDHRSKRQQTLRLPLPDFIGRVLWHAPPRGVHTTRHAGLYTSAHRLQHALAHTALTNQATAPCPAPDIHQDATPPTTASARPPLRCPQCRGPVLRVALRPALPSGWSITHPKGEISLPRLPHSTGPPPPAPRAVQLQRSSRHPTAKPGAAIAAKP